MWTTGRTDPITSADIGELSETPNATTCRHRRRWRRFQAEIESAPDSGCVVHIWIPLDRQVSAEVGASR
ncbi:MAG: hypothetical protein ACI8RE_003079, partial [Ilumatobacter sp.]